MLDCSLFVAVCPRQCLSCQFARIKLFSILVSLCRALVELSIILISLELLGVTQSVFVSYQLRRSAPLIDNLGNLVTLVIRTQWHYSQWCSEMLYFLILNHELQLLSFLEFRNYCAEYLQISQNILFSDLNPAYQVPAWGKDKKFSFDTPKLVE